MSTKQFKNKAAQEKNISKRIAYTFLLCFLLICAWVCFSVSKANAAETKKYIDDTVSYYNSIDKISAENDEYEEILEKGYDSDYFEKIARELHGYCRPGEKVYHFDE